MKHLPNCTTSADMSIFRFELDCTSYKKLKLSIYKKLKPKADLEENI